MMDVYTHYVLLVAALPFCLWATWSDLKYMKIPNLLVVLMGATFLIIGPIFLPLDVFLWRILAGLIVLAVGFALFSFGGLGGGDAKFAAVMVLFVSTADYLHFAFILSVFTIIAVILHIIVGKLGFARRITQSWDSWSVKKKFPFGFGMGLSLVIYLSLRAFA